MQNQPLRTSHSPALRAFLQYVVGWSFSIITAGIMGVICTVTLRRFNNHLVPLYMRFYGRVMLVIFGVKLHLEGMEHLEGRQMRVATFNHTSNLDAMIIPVLNPVGAVQAIKRQVLYIPLVGWGLWAMGALLLDRGNSEKSRQTLRRAAERMEREELTVFIAPEGTRSVDGELQAFRKGAFHLALSASAVIVPVVIDGAFDVYPKHRKTCLAGDVYVRVLPPFDWQAAGPQTAGELADAVRLQYVAALSQMRQER